MYQSSVAPVSGKGKPNEFTKKVVKPSHLFLKFQALRSFWIRKEKSTNKQTNKQTNKCLTHPRVVSSSLLWKKKTSTTSSFLQPFPQCKLHDHCTDVRCDKLHIAILVPERRNVGWGTASEGCCLNGCFESARCVTSYWNSDWLI